MIIRSRSIGRGPPYRGSSTRSTVFAAAPSASSPRRTALPPSACRRAPAFGLEGLNEAVQRALNVGPAEAVEMIRLPHRGRTHRDGIRFADGREVLLQSLNVGATATLAPRDLTELFDLETGAGVHLVEV